MQVAGGLIGRGGQSNGSGLVTQAQDQSIDDLERVATALQKTLAAMEHQTDVSAESAPVEYQDQLDHYYEKLSHEK